MNGLGRLLLLCLAWPRLSLGHDAPAIDHCIAANSGAESQQCLQTLLTDCDQTMTRLHNNITAQMATRVTTGDLTATHYRTAVTALQQATTGFKQYRQQECDWFAARSGAVASGYQQQRLSCLIRLSNTRIELLNQLASKNR
jgi:hypothetical protein